MTTSQLAAPPAALRILPETWCQVSQRRSRHLVSRTSDNPAWWGPTLERTLDEETDMVAPETITTTPLGRLLSGVNREVFRRRPKTLGIRELQRAMSTILQELRRNDEYVVLTNRGAPSFLLIPIDPTFWASLLVAAAPESDYELEKAHRSEAQGNELPDTDSVIGALRAHPTVP